MTSPPPPDRSEAVGAAGLLTDALNGMSERLDTVNRDSVKRDADLKRYSRHSRAYILFDIAITLLFALGGWQIADASNRADTATSRSAATAASESALHAAQLSGCVDGNQERSGELALWTYLFNASKPTSKAQAAAVDKFMALVRATFAARDCTTAYPAGGGTDGAG